MILDNCNSIDEISSTVSKLIDDKESISPSTKAKIQSRIEDIKLDIEQNKISWEVGKNHLDEYIFTQLYSEVFWYQRYIKG